MREAVIQKVLQEKIIAIVRGIDPEKGLQTAKALYDGGIRMIEVTFDQKDIQKHEDTVQLIRAISQHLPDVCVGAGTVTSVALVQRAAQAGAKYIISPDSKEDVIRETRRLGLVSMPGALTPTEITNAHDWGADFIKLFPVCVMGPAYVKAVKAPLNHVRLLAVGGVSGDNITAYLDAGCLGAGIGGTLVNQKWIDAGEFHKITQVARELVQTVAQWRK